MASRPFTIANRAAPTSGRGFRACPDIARPATPIGRDVRRARRRPARGPGSAAEALPNGGGRRVDGMTVSASIMRWCPGMTPTLNQRRRRLEPFDVARIGGPLRMELSEGWLSSMRGELRKATALAARTSIYSLWAGSSNLAGWTYPNGRGASCGRSSLEMDAGTCPPRWPPDELWPTF